MQIMVILFYCYRLIKDRGGTEEVLNYRVLSRDESDFARNEGNLLFDNHREDENLAGKTFGINHIIDNRDRSNTLRRDIS